MQETEHMPNHAHLILNIVMELSEPDLVIE